MYEELVFLYSKAACVEEAYAPSETLIKILSQHSGPK
jgi:hypothetical protein